MLYLLTIHVISQKAKMSMLYYVQTITLTFVDIQYIDIALRNIQ
jgi:hypothetical protein